VFREAVEGGAITSTLEVNEYVRKSEIVAVPCAFRKFAWMKTYPMNVPDWPAALNTWLIRTVQVAPAASVPSDDRPAPGLLVALVVKENVVPGPPAATVGKKFRVTVPAAGVAPPPVEPNGSAVVLAIARPVSNGGSTAA